ncbi:hypothetical protein D3C85_1370050 [compost metagenome]
MKQIRRCIEANVIPARYHHNPSVIDIVAHDFRIAEIPIAVYAARVGHYGVVPIIYPRAPPVFAVSSPDLLIAVTFSRMV